MAKEEIYLALQKLLSIEQPTKENVSELQQIMQLFESLLIEKNKYDNLDFKLFEDYFHSLQIFSGKCDQHVSTIFHETCFMKITYQLLVSLCQYVMVNEKPFNHLQNICAVWYNFLEYVPNQLKLNAIETYINQFQAFSNILTKIGHYSTQEKCVEIILNYSMSEHIINAIFDENLLCNALKPVGRIGFNKITLNEEIRLFLNEINTNAKSQGQNSKVVSLKANDMFLLDQKVVKPKNSDLWINLNTTTDSISFIVNNKTFFDDHEQSTELELEFYVKDIIDVKFIKVKPSEIHIEIKLKSNAIFGVNRKYNFPSITIQFLRPPKYIESFDEIDFTFGTICDAGKPKKNIIRKLGTFFYHLHSNDNYLRKLEETHLPQSSGKNVENRIDSAYSQSSTEIDAHYVVSDSSPARVQPEKLNLPVETTILYTKDNKANNDETNKKTIEKQKTINTININQLLNSKIYNFSSKKIPAKASTTQKKLPNKNENNPSMRKTTAPKNTKTKVKPQKKPKVSTKKQIKSTAKVPANRTQIDNKKTTSINETQLNDKFELKSDTSSCTELSEINSNVFKNKSFKDILNEYRQQRLTNAQTKVVMAETNNNIKNLPSVEKISTPIIDDGGEPNRKLSKVSNRRKSITLRQVNKKTIQKPTPIAPTGLKYSVSLLRGREYRDEFLKSQRSKNEFNNNSQPNDVDNNFVEALEAEPNKSTNTSELQQKNDKEKDIKNKKGKIKENHNNFSIIEDDEPIANLIKKSKNKKKQNHYLSPHDDEPKIKKHKLFNETQTNEANKEKSIVDSIDLSDNDLPRKDCTSGNPTQIFVPVIVENNEPKNVEEFKNLTNNNHSNSNNKETSKAYEKLIIDFQQSINEIKTDDIIPIDFQQRLQILQDTFIEDISENLIIHKKLVLTIKKYDDIQQKLSAQLFENMENLIRCSVWSENNFEKIQNKNLALIEEYRKLFNNEELDNEIYSTFKEKSNVISRDIWEKFLSELLNKIINILKIEL